MQEAPKKNVVTLKIQSSAFTDKDWDCIEAFKLRADQLFECEIFANGKHEIHAHAEIEVGKPPTFDITLPNEDVLKSALLSFRPFFSQDELSYFRRLINVLKRRALDRATIEALDDAKLAWDNSLFRSALTIQDSKGPVNAQRLFDLWFNAHYFHLDSKKIKELKELQEALDPRFCKYIMIDAVFNSIKLIQKVYKGIKVLKRNSE